MYRIGEFSKMTRTTIKTLRYYDEVGLLTPAHVDGASGYRYYDAGQLVALSRILSLRQAGLSVEEVKAVLNGEDLGGILRFRKGELEAEARRTAVRLSRIASLMDHEREEIMYQAIIKNLPECTVYSKEGTVKSFADYGSFVLQSAEECRAANPKIRCTQPDYCFVRYLDEYRERNIRIEYCQAVEKAGVETKTIKFKTLQSTLAVCVVHRGGYDGLGEAYAFLHRWMEENGYEPSESPREFYIDGVWNKDCREDWLTEIQMPITRA